MKCPRCPALIVLPVFAILVTLFIAEAKQGREDVRPGGGRGRLCGGRRRRGHVEWVLRMTGKAEYLIVTVALILVAAILVRRVLSAFHN